MESRLKLRDIEDLLRQEKSTAVHVPSVKQVEETTLWLCLHLNSTFSPSLYFGFLFPTNSPSDGGDGGVHSISESVYIDSYGGVNIKITELCWAPNSV